jgi:hypothetical protein
MRTDWNPGTHKSSPRWNSLEVLFQALAASWQRLGATSPVAVSWALLEYASRVTRTALHFGRALLAAITKLHRPRREASRRIVV